MRKRIGGGGSIVRPYVEQRSLGLPALVRPITRLLRVWWSDFPAFRRPQLSGRSSSSEAPRPEHEEHLGLHPGREIWGQGSNLRPVGPEPTALPLSYPRILSDYSPTDATAFGGMSGGRARTCVQSGESRPLYR